VYLDILEITIHKYLNKYVVKGKNMDEYVKCFVHHFAYYIYKFHYNLLFTENSVW